ncbi:MAG: hypothetical protein KatS3mg105_5154 [Gemmatales bacterium]|nr:MAG: hypothetical protein KatS3mg105_5154 [Gemmatales bacterium]GIW97835.1 MAG: hypothetical protein KatS3mg111_1168 [Pirellulaceae bacterium]
MMRHHPVAPCRYRIESYLLDDCGPNSTRELAPMRRPSLDRPLLRDCRRGGEPSCDSDLRVSFLRAAQRITQRNIPWTAVLSILLTTAMVLFIANN